MFRRGLAGALMCLPGPLLTLLPAGGSFAADPPGPFDLPPGPPALSPPSDPATMAAWRLVWKQNLIDTARTRRCDTELGEEIAWLISPILEGFYRGFVATAEPEWIDRLIDWTNAWVARGVTEPDGFIGWPKPGASGAEIDNLDKYNADSMLGEAMALRPVVAMSALILKDPALREKYGAKARAYLDLSRAIYRKWDQRGAWRPSGAGNISVVLPFGIDTATGSWTETYRDKDAPGQGWSHQNNKANQIALWLLAMFDATGDTIYRQRAEKWFVVMKSRMKRNFGGTYEIWNYWQPAGAWDYLPNGKPKHWIGVHPNAGYYETDVSAIVAAYEHGLVFQADDIARLVKTALTTGRVWPALAPYDPEIRRKFEAEVKPAGWREMYLVPWYLALQPGGPRTSPPPGR